jgi:glycine oxidase
MKVLVVGSGIIGLSTALYLAIEGFEVKVITRNPEEASSWVAGGMLAPFSEGLEGDLFDFSYKSLKMYPDYVKLVEDVSKLKVDFWTDGIYRVVLEGEEELLKKAEDYKSKGYKVELFGKTAIPFPKGFPFGALLGRRVGGCGEFDGCPFEGNGAFGRAYRD